MDSPICVQIVPPNLIEDLAGKAAEPAPSPSVNGHPTNGAYRSRLLVDRWLSDRNVGYRVKSEPEGKGRTVYVLAACPFDSSHVDPDACVMQGADGKMFARCLHDSCTGKGWQHFKNAIGAPKGDHYDPPLGGPRVVFNTTRSSAASANGAPATEQSPEVADGALEPPQDSTTSGSLGQIQGNKRQLREITADALQAILDHNDPPRVFQRGGVLTRIKQRAEDEAVVAEPLTDDALRGVLTRVADWLLVKDTRQGEIEEPGPPPAVVVNDLATLPSWDRIPILKGIVACPVYAAGGVLVETPGYSPGTGLWLALAPALSVPQVPASPSEADIAHARHLLVVELLHDFPFVDDASRAHALAALILPFVRDLIDGPTPLHLFDAPTEGTGKTLLASAISLVGTGRDVEAVAEAGDDAEWRKRVTAALAESPTFLLLDNINRTLDSGALAVALTGRVWKDRLLGVSKMVTLPVNCVWMASGNNTRLSRELIRRTVFCRLDAKTADPWLRAGFRHPRLLRWAAENRGQLVWAALTLVSAWLAKGRPPGRQTLGMFEAWVEVIGGIFDVAGVPGLLANAKSFRAERADQLKDWEAFTSAWWAKYATQPVGVRELFQLAVEETLLDAVLGDKGERSQRTRLGQALVRAVDRVVGRFRIVAAGEEHSGRQRFALQEVPKNAEPAAAESKTEWEA